MKLTHEDYDQLCVFTIRGDLTADDVEQVRRLARERMSNDVRDFVLDVSQMQFVDSAGLEALIWIQDQCGEKLGQMRLAGATENFEKIIEMTRLTARFDRHASVEAAIKSMR